MTGKALPDQATENKFGVTRWTGWMVALDNPGGAGLLERALLLLFQRLARLLSRLSLSPDRRVAWRELANTTFTFRLFRLGAQLLPRTERRQALGHLMSSLRRHGLFAGLWAAEGVGYHRAEELPPSPALLGDEITGALPVGSLVPLHVGAGLALARLRLDGNEGPRDDAQALSLLLEEIERSSAAGSAGVGIEAIGLMVRTLIPERLPELDAHLREHDPDVRSWFWHGVGRALYFLYPRAIYGASGWARVAEEAPDEAALRPATAGYVWALCLVNTGDPAVIESFLRRHGEGLDEAAFQHGLVGTTLVWHAWAGEDSRLRRRLEPRPTAADLAWEKRVRQPLFEALKSAGPTLGDDRRVERLFLFRRAAADYSVMPSRSRRNA